MKKVRIGIFGATRGRRIMDCCAVSDKAEVVAVCDRWPVAMEKARARHADRNITWYEDFDSFLTHDMDAVLIANYANEHAPYAIRALDAGLHVLSEVVPVQNMAEAVALVEAVERSGKIYAYAENYCFMPATREMRRLYREGKIGELEYGEGEYIHNCESVWPNITYGEPDHWRNRMYANFYCTHSLGPLIHISGLRPVSVTGFESGMNERHLRVGALGGQFGIEMVKLDNGGILKSIHGDLYRNSIWYSVYGSKGRMESARADACAGGMETLYVYADPWSGAYGQGRRETVVPNVEVPEQVRFNHGGTDFYLLEHFAGKVLGDEQAEVIGVYEALDMFLPGHFAYRSVLAGGVPMEIPDLRDPAARDRYRHDTLCTDPKAAGDSLVPPFSLGELEVDPSVYEQVRIKWQEILKNSNEE